MMTNCISKSLEFIKLLVCEQIAGFFLFKRNEKKNRKDTLTPKMPFAARFSCCATIDFNFKVLSVSVMVMNFISLKFKSLEFIELLTCEKIVFTESSINH